VWRSAVRARRTTIRCGRRLGLDVAERPDGRIEAEDLPYPPTLDRRKPLTVELEVHRRWYQRRDRDEDPLRRVADEQLPYSGTVARCLARSAERILETEQRADVEGKQLTYLTGVVDRDCRADDRNHHRPEQDQRLSQTACHL
jgi:hypothetical protein